MFFNWKNCCILQPTTIAIGRPFPWHDGWELSLFILSTLLAKDICSLKNFKIFPFFSGDKIIKNIYDLSCGIQVKHGPRYKEWELSILVSLSLSPASSHAESKGIAYDLDIQVLNRWFIYFTAIDVLLFSISCINCGYIWSISWFDLWKSEI